MTEVRSFEGASTAPNTSDKLPWLALLALSQKNTNFATFGTVCHLENQFPIGLSGFNTRVQFSETL